MFKKVLFTEEEEKEIEGTVQSRFQKPGQLAKVYLVSKDGEMSEDWYTLPTIINIDRLKNLKVYPDDIWIVTPPKSGTTWTQV